MCGTCLTCANSIYMYIHVHMYATYIVLLVDQTVL